MSEGTRSGAGVPTLTEVVQLAIERGVLPPADASHAADEQQLTQRILSDVQRQVDLMLEFRLREALAPVLAQLSEAIVREARAELASTLRDVVARAVAQEMARHRSR